jgi:putative heme-binding domain-containing protein
MPHRRPFRRLAASAAVAMGLAAAGGSIATGAGRVPWTTSHIQGSPDPVPPYVAERILPHATFKDPLDIATAPGLPQLFIAEQSGKIHHVHPTETNRPPGLFLDLRALHPDLEACYGVVFHPGFSTNHQVFVCYVLQGNGKEASRVVRYDVAADGSPRALPESERRVIAWLGGGHNGGCLKFGADGMLYVSTGDGAGPSPPDPLNTGQDITDLLSSILRIDPDHPEGGKGYRVPPDNPFLKVDGARPEVWAYGLRNPWRMCVEPGTSVLWVGDVGWELWEMIFRVDHPGMNCGWSAVESRQPVKTGGPRGPTPIEAPIADHGHDEAASITGGVFHGGGRLPELRGAYVYGDWETGRMWALRHTNGVMVSRREIAQTPLKIVAFGESPDGEMVFLDYSGGGLYRLARNETTSRPEAFPRRLSETGLFASVADERPAPGVIEYTVAAPLWSDGATARRWVAVPGTNAVRFPADAWQTPRVMAPEGTVLARTVSLPKDPPRAPAPRRVETQILHFESNTWRAYTFRWNEEQTDAVLVGASGAEEPVSVPSQPSFEGYQSIRWRYHSRAECLRCHNPWNATLLGFQPWQLAGVSAPDGALLISQLAAAGVVDAAGLPPATCTPATQSGAPLAGRARSYLHANCGHCHRNDAGGSVLLRLNLQSTDEAMKLIGQPPVHGLLGLKEGTLVDPGDPLRSILLYRFAKAGASHMPYLGTMVADPLGLTLLSEWIESMPSNSPSTGNRELLREARSLVALTPSAEHWSDRTRHLLETPQGALACRIALGVHPLPRELGDVISEVALATTDTLVRDLLTPLLPASARQETVGPSPDAARILALAGDESRGRRLFFAQGGPQCSSCHRVGGEGHELGPDLSRIGTKYPRKDLLQQVIAPSMRIDPEYAQWIVELRQGEVRAGMIRERTPEAMLLKDAAGNLHRIPMREVQSTSRSAYSLMPEGLLLNLTLQEAADLIAFLSAQR